MLVIRACAFCSASEEMQISHLDLESIVLLNDIDRDGPQSRGCRITCHQGSERVESCASALVASDLELCRGEGFNERLLLCASYWLCMVVPGKMSSSAKSVESAIGVYSRLRLEQSAMATRDFCVVSRDVLKCSVDRQGSHSDACRDAWIVTVLQGYSRAILALACIDQRIISLRPTISAAPGL